MEATEIQKTRRHYDGATDEDDDHDEDGDGNNGEGGEGTDINEGIYEDTG